MEKKQKTIQTISDLDENANVDQDQESETASRPDTQSDGIEQALAAKTEEARAWQDKYLRLAAEFDNYKRLAQRDQREQAKFANENLLKELLPVIDNLERALGFSKNDSGAVGLIQGVELTLKQFLEVLARFGVKPITSQGEPFDPSRHQAVAHLPAQGAADNTVVEEYQGGYLLHDRILRAAMVAVAARQMETNAATSDAPQGPLEEGENDE